MSSPMPWYIGELSKFTEVVEGGVSTPADTVFAMGKELKEFQLWSLKSQCVYGAENQIAAVTFFAKMAQLCQKQYFCKCNGMAGFWETRLLIEGF